VDRAAKAKLISRLSIASQGAKSQVEIAIVLVSILPLLAMFYLIFSNLSGQKTPIPLVLAIAVILLFMMTLGYVLLIRYPRSVSKLRKKLENLTDGKITNSVQISDHEEEILVLEKYFNTLISEMKERMETIEQQKRDLIDAERQRVMTESLCTACHHLGQPAMVLSNYLQLMEKEDLSDAAKANLSGCMNASKEMNSIIKDLQNVTAYRTEPYCEVPDKDSSATLLNLIKYKVDKN
jgi:signal transduction histidine kinase